MDDYELHADYDRDGRLRATPAEYAGRQEPPGALLLPNLDVDVKQGSPGKRPRLDAEQATKSRGDDDLLSLLVRVIRPTAPPGTKLSLRATGPAAGAVRLYDARGQGIDSFTLPAGELELKLEARTLPGSPLLKPMEGDPRQFRLELVGPEPGGRTPLPDHLPCFSISPFLIADNTAEVEEIYMCELPDNEPSRRDLAEALAAASLGKALRLIPAVQAQKDGWVQDQFQHGFCRTPKGWMHMIVHLPRIATNVVKVDLKPSPNLASFVASHFPASNVGLFDDFWRRAVPVRDDVPHLPFESSYPVFQQMSAVDNVKLQVLEVCQRLKLKIEQPTEPRSWLEGRAQLDNLAKAAVKQLKEREKEAEKTIRKTELRLQKESLESLVQTIDTILPVKNGGVELTLPENVRVVLNGDELDILSDRLKQMHSSVNYGGNIEASPPTDDAPLGKIVIGTSRVSKGGKAMDPALRQFLADQKAQPLVEVDTSWLEVGHVDELLTFVPNRKRGGADFAILRSSPDVALALINAARDLHRKGLPEKHPYKESYFFSDGAPRHTTEGKTPVSHLLRGKLWLHNHPRGGVEVLGPPRIYLELVEANSRLNTVADTPFSEITYWPGPEVDRLYPAGISVHEVLHYERDGQEQSVNNLIEKKFLGKLDETLAKEFPKRPILRLPVLFDRISNLKDWDEATRRAETTTVAFTPNLVNLQILGDHLLIPRPYGPRMRPDDAAFVLRQVLRSTGGGHLEAQVDAHYLSNRSRHLDRTTCWLRREEAIAVERPPVSRFASAERTIFQGISGVDDVVTLFQDGFPGQDKKEIRRRILKANEKHFRAGGQLRPGWRKLTIPEGTVDLFEAYTQVLAESLGLKVHWIDSWFYHVRLGEIHCGTNVIRKPPKNQAPWWLVAPVKS